MPDFRRLARDRVLTLGLSSRRETDLIEELAGQMTDVYESAQAGGLPSEDALRQALAVLPPPGSFGARPAWFADWRFAWRLHARRPWFLAMAVLAIAVGVGSATAVFSLVDAVVLRPLAYAEPDKLVMVWERFRGGPDNVVAPANYLAWMSRTQVLTAASPVISMTRNLVGAGEPAEVGIEAVAWDYLRLLGVTTELGRDFVPEDDDAGTPAAVLLSDRLWRQRFAADRSVVGRRLRLDDAEAVVVGVLPPGFRSLSEDPDLLTTARLDAAVDYRPRGRFMRVVARVRDARHAQNELDAVALALERERPEFNRGWGIRVTPLAEHFASRGRGPLWTLMAAVTIVLLVVCGNLTNLLLARLGARERELAVRAALGATPGRLAGQLLQEGLLLGVAGGALGCGFAWLALDWLRGLTDVPRLAEAALDWRVALFALTVTLLAVALFAWAPALVASRATLTIARGPGRSVWGAVFVALQVALALTLLLGAVTLVSRFRTLLETDAGFERGRVLTMALALPGSRQAREFYAALESKLRRLPEVSAVGAVAWLPLAERAVSTTVAAAGRPLPPPGEALTADVGVVTPGYFAAMGIPVRGHADGLVLSESLARLLFPDHPAIGEKAVVNMRDHDRPLEITGIAGDVRHAGLDQAPKPTAYYSHAEFPLPAMTLVMRAKPDVPVLGLPSAAVAMVRELDAAQPVRSIRWMDEWVSRSLAERRLVALAVSSFAVVAVALALMGVYGAFARWVEARRRELGVRLALGADTTDVVKMLARQASAVLGAGLAAGLLLSLWSGRVWGISPSPLALSGAIFAFVLLSAGAVLSPARRALQVDPLIELRQE